MSQLRKSASFRSRIPVRRNRISQQRHCCSPQNFSGEVDGVKRTCACPPYCRLRAKRSIATAGVPLRSNSHHHFQSHRHAVRHSSKRRYSSSSFSSSDESCESEAPHQKLARQSRKIPLEFSMYVSTDAISLDGLLDSVSCGSFSSPPSPVSYQNTQESACFRGSSYESLDKYNIALENLEITENAPFLPYPLAHVRQSSEASLINKYNNKNNKRNFSHNSSNNYYNTNNRNNLQEEQITVYNQFKSNFRQNMSTEARQRVSNSRTAIKKSADGVSGTANDEASKKSYYLEKQKQLSDWYYIKTNKDAVVAAAAATDEAKHEDASQERAENGEKQDGDNLASRDNATEDASLQEHNYVNCTRQLQGLQGATTAIRTSQSATFVASLNRRTALGSARYATASTSHEVLSTSSPPQRQQPVRWNNFDHQMKPPSQQQQFQHNTTETNSAESRVRKYNVLDDIEVEYNEAVDAINRSELKSSAATTRPTCPPYYCPPTYSTHSSPSHDLPAQPTASAATAESDLSNVNVRLLKQHYQQQQARPQQPQRGPKTSTEYANMSFRRRVEGGKRSKNKVELQLEHWENIGNQKGGADVAGVKCGLRAALPDGSNKLRRDGRDDAFMHNANEEGHESSSHQQQQQQQQNQQLNCDNECFSNANDAAVNATTSCNNSNRINSSSDSINKPHNRANIIYQQQQQQQQQQSQQQQQQHQQQHHLKQLLLPDTLNSHSSQQQQQHHQHQYQQHPASTTAHSHRKMQEQQQQQEQQAQQQLQALYDEVETKEEDEDEEAEAESDLEEQCSSQPTAAPRRFAYTPTATPRTVLRSRQIQKRADETSCSSFEQLNIVGIPTGDDDVTPDEDADTHAFDVDASMATLALTRDDCGGAQQGFNNNRYSDDRDESTLQASATQQNATAGFLDKTEQNQEEQKTHRRIFSPSNRPLPELPPQFQHQQIQLHLKQNPQTRQHFGVLDTEMFPPKTTPTCRSECDLSGSYASLECPSPPGPPVSLPESRRDPQARLSNYLRTFYTDLALKESVMPQWAIPVAPGALCAARLEPELRLSASSHGFCDTLTVDQILVSVQTKEGNFIEAPRRCLIECPSWASRSNLCLRILHAWAKEPPWPTKGTPVALALFIPLTELKRSFSQYVEKELLAKGPLNPFSSGIGGFSAAWNSLEALGPKLLFVLDGYESQKLGNLSFTGGTPKKSKTNTSLVGTGNKNHYPSDVHDLLEGKLFPEARVIIMTSSTTCPELLSIIQRHITYEGLTWGRSASLLGGGQWGGPCRLLDVIQESVHLRKVVRTPLGCLAVTAIYESSGGDLPTDELDIVESIMTCIAPEASAIHVSELGRLALFCLKMKRPSFTLAEMRMYCSSPESPLLGCLERNLLLGKTAKKKGEYIYNPVCSGMMELLAANYIASLASRPGLLAAEITGMAVGDELDADLLKVLKFAMTLLGDRAHILLSRLTPLWLTPQIVFTLALAGGPSEDNLAALCDILGISKHPPISPLETKPLWVQVRSVPTDLMGWGMALKSPTCTLKNLEVIYQLEKQNLLESRKAIEVFLDSLISNESVSTLKLSSLIEMDVKESEISYLAGCVSKILLKPRLENFELVLTLLEEDPPILKLQSVVAALCRTIPRQPRLSFLLLDLTLSTSQLVQLCATLEKCPNVTRLSLPHLRCERGAIAALASLLNSRPISFLSLPSCWGARDDPPSSSGVSMGSGSGSSTGTSGLIKQGSLPGVPSPRSYAPGIFSSLPRGVFVPQSSLGRSATLPRQPLEQTLDKRSCDSVVSKTWYPTPACDGGPHNSGTLHELFLAARDSYSKLHGFDLSKAQLSLEDSMCLGETVRLSNTLHTLKLEGSSRLSEVLPSVLGASESSCLQMLSIGSPRLSLEDSAIAMCARALTSCSTLRLLSLDGWSFRVENPSTLSIVRAFLSLTSIRELSLANCRLQIGLVKSDVKISHAFESRSVVVLKLAGAQATLGDSTVIRGPQLLQYIGGFPCLRELDLSAPARSGLGSTHTTPLILDDKCIVNFFQNLHTHFGLLNTLKICHWVIHFDEMSKTLKTISKCMRNSPISHLKVDGICVLDRPKKQRSEVNLIHCFIASLPQIRWMGISLAGKKEEQITGIGNAVLDLKGYEIDIKLSESTIEHAKLMAQAISLDGKFDIKVSTFGTSSGILVHAEKSGTKSLTRKTKD